MMATPISGRKGRLYADTSSGANGSAKPIANLNSWSISQATDRTEVTAFGDTTKTYIAGLRDASGDFGGFHDTDGELYNATDGEARKFYLYESSDLASSKYWYGTATFDITTNGTVGGAVEVSGSWAAASSVTRVD
jgi:hypothetical protein